jgi:DNA repair exonuclease SbcCD nuclease subunit
MKVLCIGDPHFRVDNIPEVDEFIEKLLPLIDSSNPDFIVVLGDVLHTHERLHTIPLNKAYDFINLLRQKKKTFVLVGNHDYIQNQQFLTENHWMNGMKEWDNVTIVDKVISAYDNKFVFCPYVPPGRFEEALNGSGLPWKEETQCIFAHQEFFGCKMGAIISTDGDKWEESNPYVVSGHIHSKQKPQPNIYYTGSAMQHAFGESEQNIIAVIDYDKKSINIHEVDLGLKRKKIVYVAMDSVDTFSLSPSETKDDIKLTLKGQFEDFKAFKKTEKYKELTKTGVKVVFKTDKKEEALKDEFLQKQKQSADISFEELLKNITYRKNDKELVRLYELLVNNNEVLIL